MEQEDDAHIRLDDINPSVMEGEIGDKSVDENLDFDDRESHSDTGLHGSEMRCASIME